MKATVRSVFNAPAARVWEEVRKPQLLRHIAGPLITFDLLEPNAWPDEWREGRYHVGMRFAGFLPVGKQWIATTTPQPEDHARGVYRIRDNGVGDIATTWDHLITISARPDGACDYVDEVEVKAGVLTLGVWLFANWFYRHRQARWRGLIARNFQYGDDQGAPKTAT